MTKDKRDPYVRGYERGEQDGQEALKAETAAIRINLPDSYADRTQWLNGYTQGLRRIVLDAPRVPHS